MIEYALQILAAYIITAVIVNGGVTYRMRGWIKLKTRWLVFGGRHFLDCRLCVGLWVSITVAFAYGVPHNILLIYGASYFLATQER